MKKINMKRFVSTQQGTVKISILVLVSFSDMICFLIIIININYFNYF